MSMEVKIPDYDCVTFALMDIKGEKPFGCLFWRDVYSSPFPSFKSDFFFVNKLYEVFFF